MAKDDQEQDLDAQDEQEQEDEELENEDEVEDESEDESTDESESESTESDKKPLDKTEKRIRDLQSALDKAIAENNKLKKEAPAAKPKANAKRDPEVERWIEMARDNARSRLYDSEPLLKEMGISSDVITGETPEEMQASMKSLVQMAKRIETRTRNKVLREHGFSPEPKSSGAEPRRNFSTMKDDEFQKLVKEVVRG